MSAAGVDAARGRLLRMLQVSNMPDVLIAYYCRAFLVQYHGGHDEAIGWWMRERVSVWRAGLRESVLLWWYCKVRRMSWEAAADVVYGYDTSGDDEQPIEGSGAEADE